MLRKYTLAILLAACCASILAQHTHLINDPTSQPVFELRVFDVDDGPFMSNGPDLPPFRSTWNLNKALKDGVIESLTYWPEIIRPKPGYLPGIINIGTFDDNNAAASSPYLENGMTLFQGALSGVRPEGLIFDSHAQIILGHYNFDETSRPVSQQPQSPDKSDLFGTTFHELAHALGIASSVSTINGDDGKPHFDDELCLWSQHLRDDNGKPARPGQLILCSDVAFSCSNPYDSSAFDLRKDQGYFTGTHVQDVLAGALPGIPVKILGDGYIDNNYMSHIELKNSLIRHQAYTNYTNFMEAELAALQDLGYDIDRRNFFGRSIYGSSRQLVNTQGYFGRNSAGTAYMPGQYNTATLGLGLHIYGSHNVVYQQADLLTQGPGGAGARVDGVGNILVIQPGTRIHADGLNGRGLIFAYGKDHSLIQRGDVQALGDRGIGASFDFGNGGNGNQAGYHGSYIYERNFAPAPGPLPSELNGPLVQRFDLAGRVAGNMAAIYISPNALVENVNIMQGARVQGDIYSLYNETDPAGRPRLSQVTFGQKADSLGQATGKRDPHFTFVHSGNIQGGNLALAAQGGRTSLNGTHDVHSVRVEPGATLAGNSRYAIRPGQAFVNDGTVAPGNSIGRIEIDGNYRQGAAGSLLMETDGSGAHDILAVSGTADLNGKLVLSPLPDWYSTSWSLHTDELL